MIMTFVLIIVPLIALNFVLLVFSCNKITTNETNETNETKPVKQPAPLITSQLDPNPLAPTGS